ncbi:MAG TPA: M42 family metallopeptidase, partial [Chroococcales cyanobacterium]
MEGLKKLCDATGISGREEKVRALVKDELKPLADDLHTDALGNVIALKRGKGKPSVMLAAHMDEIGFIVSHIDEHGFLSVNPVGGIDARNLVSRQMIVHGRKEVLGVMAYKAKPIHIMDEEEKKKIPKPTDFYVDLGLSKEEVLKNVRIGDPVTYAVQATEVGNHLCGKCLDDRVGVYIMIEALKRLKGKKLEADVFAVATVQEEVGTRGAMTSGYGIDPDVAIAIDVTIAGDVPSVKEADQISTLGGGVSISVMDSGSISNYKLVNFLRELAEKKNIKHQMGILPRGGTDAMAIQKAKKGVPVVTLSVPTRYLHSPTE